MRHPATPNHLATLQGKTQFLQKAECCAGALEGRFIATLCRLTGAKTVLEVGMFTGTTTLAVAQALPDDGKVGRRQELMQSRAFTCIRWLHASTCNAMQWVATRMQSHAIGQHRNDDTPG
jgi:O-methyltransferase